MRHLITICYFFLLFTNGFAQLGTCLNPIPAQVLTPIVIPFAQDDGVTAACSALTSCGEIADAYYQFNLPVGSYIVTTAVGNGSIPIHYTWLNSGCDTVVQEYCGPVGITHAIYIYRAGKYTLCVGGTTLDEYTLTVVRGQYMIPFEPYPVDCGLVGITPPVNDAESVKVLQSGCLECWRTGTGDRAVFRWIMR